MCGRVKEQLAAHPLPVANFIATTLKKLRLDHPYRVSTLFQELHESCFRRYGIRSGVEGFPQFSLLSDDEVTQQLSEVTNELRQRTEIVYLNGIPNEYGYESEREAELAQRYNGDSDSDADVIPF